MKLGLVLEGGGMKCAYTAAILDRMMDDQVKPDYVIGVSAGCACGASFLAGQRDRNRRFFVDHVQDPEYLGLQAWKSSGSVFNLRRIYQDYTAEGGIDPLDYDAMVKNPAEWWAVATDVSCRVVGSRDRRGNRKAALFHQGGRLCDRLFSRHGQLFHSGRLQAD